MPNFAIIDTETNYENEVISIGVVISNDANFEIINSYYYIIIPESLKSAMYTHRLYFKDNNKNYECTREQAILEIEKAFNSYNIVNVFAYNASFDYNHLPELNHYKWYDIMKIAAYKQYNNLITSEYECWSTGRLKCNYGVQSIYRLLYNEPYAETHNALIDACDELKIMKALKRKIFNYIPM